VPAIGPSFGPVTLRSASNSSTSQQGSPYRKYQRTAAVITWGGNRKPAKTGAVGRVVTGPAPAVRDLPGQTVPLLICGRKLPC